MQLVIATDVDAVLQGPGANLGCPDLQGADRHHLARQEQAHQHRQPQPQEQQHGIAQERGVEGGKGLPQGLGQEHRPAHRGDGGVGRQSRSAEQVRRGHGGLWSVCARRTRMGGLHLGLRGEIELLQDQADIRVGDEIAPSSTT